MLRLRRRDDGQLTLLVVGYAVVAILLITVGIDASKVFLARRALASAADAAALAGAQAIDRDAVYTRDDGGCAADLPLDRDRAARMVAVSLDDAVDLRHAFAVVDPPRTTVATGRVSVSLGGDVSLPFGRVVALLDPHHADGRVHIEVTAHAEAPLAVPGGC